MIVGQIQPDAKPVVIGWVVLPELGVAGWFSFWWIPALTERRCIPEMPIFWE